MGLSEDGEDAVESQFEELCLDLNMDKKARDEALENYQKILENYSLEACFLSASLDKIFIHPDTTYSHTHHTSSVYFH